MKIKIIDIIAWATVGTALVLYVLGCSNTPPTVPPPPALQVRQEVEEVVSLAKKTQDNYHQDLALVAFYLANRKVLTLAETQYLAQKCNYNQAAGLIAEDFLGNYRITTLTIQPSTNTPSITGSPVSVEDTNLPTGSIK